MVVVGNKITPDNRYPATESLTVKVRCEVPAILSLSHSLPAPPSTCPVSDEVLISSLLHVLSLRVIAYYLRGFREKTKSILFSIGFQLIVFIFCSLFY